MTERIIRALPKDLADKIAAGEVVERPLSIVKELLENSLDAGATAVTVELSKGGKEYIRVSDDGCGIAKEQLGLAFKRYATSKLATEEDLNNIGTLGFRGEALASIASVSYVELLTKTAGARTGSRIRLTAGEVDSIEDAACEEGTTVIVRELFFNTPARLKFLKPDNTEAALITDFVSKMALAYPAIKIRLISNGNILFSTPGKGELYSAILTVYGPKLARALLPLNDADDKQGLSVRGYISAPTESKTNRKWQIFFVNGRLVKSRLLENALAAAYRDKLFEGRYPMALAFIELPFDELDVNIHPHKTEVRFYKEAELSDFVQKAVRRALLNPDALNYKDKRREAALPKLDKAAKGRAEAGLSYDKTTAPAAISFEGKLTDGTCDPLGEKYFVGPRTGEPATPFNANESAALGSQGEEGNAAAPELCNEAQQAAPLPRFGEDKAAASFFKALRGESEKELQVQETLEEFSAGSADKEFFFSKLQLIGQAFSTYLICKDALNVYFIDQHAAHERIMYERLLAGFNSEAAVSQPLLTPVLIELTRAQKIHAEDELSLLSKLGFELSEFGPSAYRLEAIPACLGLSEAEDFVNAFFEDSAADAQLKRNEIISKACKAAVKAHDHLSEAEIKQLFTELDQCENPFSCPHGRPVFMRFSEYEIERMFKRK